jgi:outer membrane protein OmpA-like peptidoglycan-associated protein
MKYILSLVATVLISFSSFAQNFTIEGNEVIFIKKVSFKKGTADLTPESTEALKMVKDYLETKSFISMFRIEGHVANEGSNNQELSAKRAAAVGNWLIDNGIDCKRLILVAFGKTKPITNDEDDNTRIVFANAELRGRAIGGMPIDGGGRVVPKPCE